MRVPVYDSPQVGAAALPAVRQTLDVRNGLGAVGQGVAQLGRGVQHVVDVQDEATRRAQHEADVAASTKAITDWQNRAVDVEHGTADGKTPGFYSLQGDAAVAQSAPTLEQLAKAQKEIAKGLANDTQRQLFLGHTSGLMVGHRKAVEDYASRQIQVVQAQRAKALTDSAVRVAGANYADDGMAADAEETARAALFAHMVGQPEEAKQEVLGDLRQRMASARLDSAIQGEDLGTAERLLADRGAQLGPARAKYERTVATLKAKKLGEKNAAATIAIATNPDTGLVDEAALDEAFDRTPEAARTPEFIAAFDKQKAAALALDKGHRAGVFREALTQYLQGGGLAGVDAQHESWLVQNDPEGWRRLQRIATEDAAAKQRAARGGAGSTAGQQVALGALLVDMGDHPDKYARMPVEQFVRTWFPLLSPGDRDKALQKLGERHKEAAKPEKLGPLEERMLLHVGRDAGVFPSGQNDTSKWNDAQFRAYYHASQALSERAASVKAQTGKPPAPDQMEKWARDIFLNGKVPGSGLLFDDKTTRIEAVEEGKPFEPSWTDEEVDQATNALRAAGARVDDAAVDAYLRRRHELPAAPISAAGPKGQSEPSTTTSSIPVSMRTNGR